uniref:Uncharacterized protein n=1 Tax=Parascaris univalens TaxID=6257 RepID=A0A915BFK8_PARUN
MFIISSRAQTWNFQTRTLWHPHITCVLEHSGILCNVRSRILKGNIQIKVGNFSVSKFYGNGSPLHKISILAHRSVTCRGCCYTFSIDVPMFKKLVPLCFLCAS